MATAIKVPNVGESVTEVTLSKWLVNEGDYVEVDQEICELESDKATLELPAEVAGRIHLIAQEGDDLEIGAVIAEIDESAAKAQEEKKEAPAEEQKKSAPSEDSQAEEKTGSYAEGYPSPAAQKLMAEHGLKAEDIKGSGKDGRITKEDVLKAIEEGEKAESKPAESEASATTSAPAAPKSSPDPAPRFEFSKESFSREEKREPMSRLRRTIAQRLVAAKNETAMLTTFNEVNMEPIMNIRKQYKESFKKQHGVGLGFMSFFTRACVLSLQKFPAINARIDGNELVYHNYVDVGIAVSTDRGLIVPVIRNAESLSMAEIEARVMDLATRGRDGKLDMDEMQGGTFTITNGGVFGSLLSTPIINIPQSAILGMHKIEQRPIAENGQVVIKPMMYMALSYDHRVVDGKESVSFLVSVKEYLEHPEKMLSGKDPVQELLQL